MEKTEDHCYAGIQYSSIPTFHTSQAKVEYEIFVWMIALKFVNYKHTGGIL
jgi:hypothetical protein